MIGIAIDMVDAGVTDLRPMASGLRIPSPASRACLVGLWADVAVLMIDPPFTFSTTARRPGAAQNQRKNVVRALRVFTDSRFMLWCFIE